MKEALEEAKKAVLENEVPVGAVIVKDGLIISRAHNLREKTKDPSAHAEFLCMIEAAKKLESWRLDGCTLYVTLEPCPMCAGLIINARVPRVVLGAMDEKAGAVGSLYDLAEGKLNHKPIVVSGVLADECGRILTEYFRKKRLEKSRR